MGDMVQTEDGSYQKVINAVYNGVKDLVKIVADNSEELILTKDHKVLTNRGWVEAGKITNRDLIKHFWASDDTIELGTDIDWCLGLLSADGDLCNTTPNIACSSEEFAIKAKGIFDKTLDLDCKIRHHTRCWYLNLTYKEGEKYYHTKGPIRLWLESLGLYKNTSYNKTIPKITKRFIGGVS